MNYWNSVKYKCIDTVRSYKPITVYRCRYKSFHESVHAILDTENNVLTILRDISTFCNGVFVNICYSGRVYELTFAYQAFIFVHYRTYKY